MNITRIYVPMAEKISVIQSIMELSMDAKTGIFLPAHLEIYKKIYTYKLYTDYEINEEKTPTEIYDEIVELERSGKTVLSTNAEYKEINKDITLLFTLLDSNIDKYEKYYQSAYGILESIKEDYKDFGKNADEVISKLSNSKEELGLVSDIITKLG